MFSHLRNLLSKAKVHTDDSSVNHHMEVKLPLVQTAKEYLLPLVSEDLATSFQQYLYKVLQYLLQTDILLAP